MQDKDKKDFDDLSSAADFNFQMNEEENNSGVKIFMVLLVFALALLVAGFFYEESSSHQGDGTEVQTDFLSDWFGTSSEPEVTQSEAPKPKAVKFEKIESVESLEKQAQYLESRRLQMANAIKAKELKSLEIKDQLVAKKLAHLESELAQTDALLNDAAEKAKSELQRQVDNAIRFEAHRRDIAKAKSKQKEFSSEKYPITIVLDKSKITFNLVPPGQFVMGEPLEEKQKYVKIDEPFYMGISEITQEQWSLVMKDNPSTFKSRYNSLPAENMSWYACRMFLRALERLEGLPRGVLALPSEEQWEYSCRAGSKAHYSYGFLKSDLKKGSWYNEVAKNKTHAVASKAANAWGLYDMHGNVREWCRRSVVDSDPCVSRGGSWDLPHDQCFSYSRRLEPKGSHSSSIGLRLVYLPELFDKIKKTNRAKELSVLKQQQAVSPTRPLEWKLPMSEIVLRLVPKGSFQMGGKSFDDNSMPIHKVTFEDDFYMGQFEVTQKQWIKVMGENLSRRRTSKQLPADNVNWTNAQVFMQKLAELEKLPLGSFAMPTEAQWEYTCRAGRDTEFGGELDAMAWYQETAGRRTHEVGQKKANDWGFYDMHGNVWEWCLDDYLPYNLADAVDPCQLAPTAKMKVIRGGGWLQRALHCASRTRFGELPSRAGSTMGLRVCLNVKMLDKVKQEK